MRKLSTLLLLLSPALLVASSYPSGHEADLRVISSDDRGIVIEFLPRFHAPGVVEDEGAQYQVWTFDGAGLAEELIPGSPQLFSRAIPLGLPGTAGHRVEILSVNYDDLTGILLAPHPEVHGDFETIQRRYATDRQRYGSAEFLPNEIVEFRNLGVVRNMAMGQVHVWPLQYNPSSRILRKYNRILLRVNFGPAEYQVGTIDPKKSLVLGVPLNFEQAKHWWMEQRTVLPLGFRNSNFASGPFFRFTITENGMYKLTGAALLAAGVPASTDPRTIRILSNGGAEPPHHPLAPYPADVLELATYVHDGGSPGSLDPDDYIVFYGQAPRHWWYNPSTKELRHRINHYTEVSYYWLTYGGQIAKRMVEIPSLNVQTPYTPDGVTGMVFRHDERVNVQHSGRQWLGQSLNNNESITYLFALPGFDPSKQMTYRFAIGAKNWPTSSRYDIFEHDNLLTSVTVDATKGEYFSASYVSMRQVTVTPASNSFVEPLSRLRLALTTGSSGIGYIDWIEVLYGRQLQADGNVFHFFSHDTTAVTVYSIGGFASTPNWIFDVTRHDSVVRITNAIVSGGQCTFQTQLTGGAAKEFYVVGDLGFRTPGPLVAFPNQNLHGDTTSVDMIIVSHRDFLPAAQRLKAHRERPGMDRLTVRIVDVDQIYNEFSGGQPSPVGIRNYLRYLYYTSSPPPKYILLFGDGDYDYRRISAPGPNWIPPWETLESFAGSPLNSFAVEDSIVMVTGATPPDYAVGRLAVRSLQQAHDVVNKIIEYETSITPDPWKIRATFVADDGLTSEGNDGTLHTWQADSISRLIPSIFEIQKIFIAEYPTVVTSAGRRKPLANEAIIDRMNRGTVLLNFTGHGNPRLWTHEHVFVRENDFPRLTNQGKYFLLVAATCNYSQFDHPFDQSGGELLVNMRNAGAIGTLSATRAVFADANFRLNRTFYNRMFALGDAGRMSGIRLGEAYYQTKLVHSTTGNDRKFLLIGDPSLVMAFPRMLAAIDTINNVPADSLVHIQALGSVSLAATIHDPLSLAPSPDYSGTALVTVYDADRTVTIRNDDPFVFTYTASGGVIFRGQSNIESGRLSSSFVVPKDISYANDRGRISLYFWNASSDGAGATRNVVVGGTNPNAAIDTTGPRINLYLDHRGFRSGDLVGENPLLIADLFDEHGMNTAGTGIGHRIEAWINDNPQSIDLTDFYTSKLDSYQEGTIEYRLTGLTPGSHRLRLRAWDTYNNPSTVETNFDVLVRVGLQIANVFNYPNPFATTTHFTFEHNQTSPVDVEVKIYTVAGRLIESLRVNNVTDQFVRVPWNGRDREGDELANGVYLYKVIVRTNDGRLTSEALGKLSKLR